MENDILTSTHFVFFFNEHPGLNEPPPHPSSNKHPFWKAKN